MCLSVCFWWLWHWCLAAWLCCSRGISKPDKTFCALALVPSASLSSLTLITLLWLFDGGEKNKIKFQVRKPIKVNQMSTKTYGSFYLQPFVLNLIHSKRSTWTFFPRLIIHLKIKWLKQWGNNNNILRSMPDADWWFQNTMRASWELQD